MSPQEFLNCYDWLSPGSVVTVMTDFVTSTPDGGRRLLLPDMLVTVLNTTVVDLQDSDCEFRIDLLTQDGAVVETLTSRDFITKSPAHQLWAIDSTEF